MMIFKNLSPIQQLDTVLTFLAENSVSRTTLSRLETEVEINDYKTAEEIIGRLIKDGYVTSDGSIDFMGQGPDVHNITFDGRLFQSIGGYANQQRQIEEVNNTNARNNEQRANYEKRLLYGTWFAGISAALVLVWYIFVWFYPNYTSFQIGVGNEIIKPTTDNILTIDTTATAAYPDKSILKK